jgi:hypothetical protein
MASHCIATSSTVFLIGILLCSVTTEAAITFDLKNRANPRLSIQVGAKGNKISEVAFSVPASQLGNGTVISGTPAINIEVEIRASAADPLTAFLTVDSFSHPLTIDAPGSTARIPFSQISWTARDGDIPSGSFADSIDQPIVNFPSSQGYSDVHTFNYANTLGLEAGTYTGRVIYTWAVP